MGNTDEKDKDVPQVRIFPHSPEEYPTKDHLMEWLREGLRSREGEYHLTSNRVKYFPPQSVALFRYGHEIIGEALVAKGKELCPGKDYAAQVTFIPTSIRLYEPPVDMNKIQTFVNESQMKKKPKLGGAQPYYKLDWDVYDRIRKEAIPAAEIPRR